MKQFLAFGFIVAQLIYGCGGRGPASFVTVTVSPAPASVDIGGTQQFTATVTGIAQREVVWTISGAGCSGDACGTIDAAGMYSAPDDPPNPPTFDITATSEADPSWSGSANVTVTTTTNALFNGQYALLLNGFDGHGRAAIAGSITADGNGGVTGGELDANTTGDGPQRIPVTGGSYSFGADDRGRLSLTTAGQPFFFRFAMSARTPASHNGRLISFRPSDASYFPGSGVIKKQTPEDFTRFGGNFVAGFSGELDSGRPVAAIGRLYLDSSGAARDGAMDANLTGDRRSDFGITVSCTAIDRNGRGQASLNSRPQHIGDLNFSFYIVSASEAFFVGADRRTGNLPLLSGSVLKQSQASFTPNSMAGPLVFNLTGTTGSGSDVTVGRLHADAAARTLSGGMLDRNAAGIITESRTFTGTYNVAPSGRGTLNFQLDPLTSVAYAFYLVGPNSAFLLQANAPEVGEGFIEAQSGGPFTTASLSEGYIFGTAQPADCNCTNVSGVVTLNGPAGTFMGARDKSASDGLFPRDNWAGTFGVLSDNGRGRMVATTPSIENSVLYAISPNKFVMINTDPTIVLPVVTIVER